MFTFISVLLNFATHNNFRGAMNNNIKLSEHNIIHLNCLLFRSHFHHYGLSDKKAAKIIVDNCYCLITSWSQVVAVIIYKIRITKRLFSIKIRIINFIIYKN